MIKLPVLDANPIPRFGSRVRIGARGGTVNGVGGGEEVARRLAGRSRHLTDLPHRRAPGIRGRADSHRHFASPAVTAGLAAPKSDAPSQANNRSLAYGSPFASPATHRLDSVSAGPVRISRRVDPAEPDPIPDFDFDQSQSWECEALNALTTTIRIGGGREYCRYSCSYHDRVVDG
jgi:hypothetical protein